jgi:hypothetical protein
VNSFQVEPSLLRQLAGRFGGLMLDFASLGVAGFDLGATGDANLTRVIEELIDWSHGEVAEFSSQFGQLQSVLVASAAGYEAVDTRLGSEIEASLSAAEEAAGSLKGTQ